MDRAAGLQWISCPAASKAATPSVMCRNRVDSLLRSFSASARVSCSTWAMWLKFCVRVPISSRDETSSFLEKSPEATACVPRVSCSMGEMIICERIKLSAMQKARPSTSARRMMRTISPVRALTVPRLSST